MCSASVPNFDLVCVCVCVHSRQKRGSIVIQYVCEELDGEKREQQQQDRRYRHRTITITPSTLYHQHRTITITTITLTTATTIIIKRSAFRAELLASYDFSERCDYRQISEAQISVVQTPVLASKIDSEYSST